MEFLEKMAAWETTNEAHRMIEKGYQASQLSPDTIYLIDKWAFNR